MLGVHADSLDSGLISFTLTYRFLKNNLFYVFHPFGLFQLGCFSALSSGSLILFSAMSNHY